MLGLALDTVTYFFPPAQESKAETETETDTINEATDLA